MTTKAPANTMATTTVSANDYHERVLSLMAHIEDVLDPTALAMIDTSLWNDVTMAEPEIVYSE